MAYMSLWRPRGRGYAKKTALKTVRIFRTGIRCGIAGERGTHMQSPITIPRTPGWVAEFRAFIMRGNVVDLAVGIIIGVAFSAIVGSLVKDIINPLIGLVIGGVDFSNIFIPLNGQHYASLDAAQKAAAPTINIGLFINAIINFLIISFAIF